LSDGQVYAWGENNHYQLGVESEQQTFLSVPTLVSSLQSVPVVGVSAGFAHNIAITAGGVALSWGRNRCVFGEVHLIGVLSDYIGLFVQLKYFLNACG